MTLRQNPAEIGPGADAKEDHLQLNGHNVRLRIYIGEDKRHGEQPLYEAIVLKARQLQLAGATVVKGIVGYGRSTRLHTTEVVFSEDLPVVVEIVDAYEKVQSLVALLSEINEIGLVTCDELNVLLYPPVATPADQASS
jgi:PII-like signaling protein